MKNERDENYTGNCKNWIEAELIRKTAEIAPVKR